MTVQQKWLGWNISPAFLYTNTEETRPLRNGHKRARTFQFDNQGDVRYFQFYDAKGSLSGWLSGTGWFSADCNRLSYHFISRVFLDWRIENTSSANAAQGDKDKL